MTTSRSRARIQSALFAAALAIACSGGNSTTEPSSGDLAVSGGSGSLGGSSASAPSGGMNTVTGGSHSGGSQPLGSTTATTAEVGGGAPTAGGNGATTSSTGGSASGGSASGGASGTRITGGTSALGGSSAVGGARPTLGGATGTGGTRNPAGGTSSASGGTVSSGGTSTTGGNTVGGSTSNCTTYVDSVSGSDTNDGKTTATAWKTLAKVNTTTFQPGASLCFRAGGSWTGQLAPKGSGSASAPVTIDQYGTGAKPKLTAGASDLNTVSLVNQSYWEINNLDIANTKSSVGDYRGIQILGRDAGTLEHIYIRNCAIHDVTGEVNWIGGDVADNKPGVKFQTGWDASKRTGGIVVEVQSTAATPVKTKFNDIKIENNVITNCSFAGISFKQLDGSVHWGVRSSAADSKFMPHTNIVIRNNFISQSNATLGCNGIYLTDSKNALIERNVVAQAGTSGIELYYTDSVTVQYNETFGTVRKAGGADHNGIDTDKGTTNSIIQYNYVHDNGDGILLCQFAFGDSVVRYNVLTNNSRYQIYLHSDKSATSAIYNNTVYVDKYNASLVYGYGTALDADYLLTNNIFDSTRSGAVLTTGGGIVYDNNLYFGSSVTAPSMDKRALKADPRFVGPGQGGTGTLAGPALTSLGGYKLSAGSPAVNSGTAISGNGELDFWSNRLYTGAPDIGAYEAP